MRHAAWPAVDVTDIELAASELRVRVRTVSQVATDRSWSRKVNRCVVRLERLIHVVMLVTFVYAVATAIRYGMVPGTLSGTTCTVLSAQYAVVSGAWLATLEGTLNVSNAQFGFTTTCPLDGDIDSAPQQVVDRSPAPWPFDCFYATGDPAAGVRLDDGRQAARYTMALPVIPVFIELVFVCFFCKRRVHPHTESAGTKEPAPPDDSESRAAFLAGTHPRAGAQSAVRGFTMDPTFDPYLLRVLFEFDRR